MVICLELGTDLHMAQLMPLPLTVSCFSKIQIGFAFLVPARPGSPGKRAVKQVCACVCMYVRMYVCVKIASLIVSYRIVSYGYFDIIAGPDLAGWRRWAQLNCETDKRLMVLVMATADPSGASTLR